MGKACEAEGCSTRASYGFAGEKRQRCKAHALAGMVRAGSSWHTGGLQSVLYLSQAHGNATSWICVTIDLGCLFTTCVMHAGPGGG